MRSKCLFLWVLLLTSAGLCAQTHVEDVVELTNGSKFRGQIVAYEYGSDLYIVLRKTADTLRIPHNAILKVVQQPLSKLHKDKSEYRYQETGWYYALRGGFNVGRDVFYDELSIGPSFEFVGGHKFSRMLNVGVGIGYDYYNQNLGYEVEIIPIFADVRGYFSKKNVSPYYRLAAGYGFGLRWGDDTFLTKATGGLLLHPSLGVRFGGGQSAFTLDIGWRFQKAKYEGLLWGSPDQTFINSHHLRRFSLGFGILF